jgi:hypothetical protein
LPHGAESAQLFFDFNLKAFPVSSHVPIPLDKSDRYIMATYALAKASKAIAEHGNGGGFRPRWDVDEDGPDAAS